jgi:Cu-Zn family superoxide dismutase
VFAKEITKTAPAPTANPAANAEVGWGAATATIAPTATRPNRRGRETAMGGTAGIIGCGAGIMAVLMKERDMKKPGILGSVALAAVALLVWAYATASETAPGAKTSIESRSGSKVTGKAVFTELPSGGTKVEVWIENATPGTHGLHLHEKGDCSAPDATSAGGHFNAAGNPHAGPADKAHHNGDLGNIEIGADGKGHLEITSDMLTVKPGPNSVVGKSVVFHEKADDLKTQPTGNAGGRFGCGVIQSAREL